MKLQDEMENWIKEKYNMDFNTYQDDAVKTAIYPDTHKILYPALGMAGEAGEVANRRCVVVLCRTCKRYQYAVGIDCRTESRQTKSPTAEGYTVRLW